jgi:hypothetical protein
VSDSEENEMEFEDESPAAAKKPAAVAKKPSTVPNVDDEGSSANDNKPLAQLFEKKVSKPQKGAATKQKKRSGSLQKIRKKENKLRLLQENQPHQKRKMKRKMRLGVALQFTQNVREKLRLPLWLKVQQPRLLGLIPARKHAQEIFSSKVCSMYVIKILLFHV